VISLSEGHKFILDSLNKEGFIKVVDMAKSLDVIAVAFNKDLKYLEEKKLLY
jgi:DeoR family transcriptional regulator of aga operon